jgi:hypothetical protein
LPYPSFFAYTPFEEDAMLQRTYYQYYTNVTYRTCPQCLTWHGKISRDPKVFPKCENGCERSIIPFRHKELSYYREQGRKMRAAAQAELARRELFKEGIKLLGIDNERAFELLERSTKFDLYIPELERLVHEKGEVLREDAEFRERLKKRFIRAYSDKFGWRRYERLPELMRIAREEAGIKKIKELFA